MESRKAIIKHIASPVAPINVKPASRRMKKKVANQRGITTSSAESSPSIFSVILGECCSLRVGLEKGVLNTNAVIKSITAPVYQSLCYAQMPRLLAYVTTE